MYQGRRRSAARILAPLALVLSVAAVLVVVQATTKSDDSNGDRGREPATGQRTKADTIERPRPVRPTYTVKLGDTLGLIAEKTGVSVERIEALNPELDPQNLIVGQKIKLRE
jgi:LysM repeat protein